MKPFLQVPLSILINLEMKHIQLHVSMLDLENSKMTLLKQTPLKSHGDDCTEGGICVQNVAKKELGGIWANVHLVWKWPQHLAHILTLPLILWAMDLAFFVSRKFWRNNAGLFHSFGPLYLITLLYIEYLLMRILLSLVWKRCLLPYIFFSTFCIV